MAWLSLLLNLFVQSEKRIGDVAILLPAKFGFPKSTELSLML
jgi:hypothetical protein